jgi:hypothetical protein
MEPLDEAAADRVAAAVTACPGVARLADADLAGTLATYLPGRRVTGVRAGPDGLELALVARWGVAIPGLVTDVRAAVRPLVGDGRVDVHVVDVEEPAVVLTRPTARVDAGGP